MAKSGIQEQPEYQLKHRLTGAIILVAVAVLLIPLLLTEPGMHASADRAVSATPAATTKKTFVSKIEPLNTSQRLAVDPSNAGDEEDKPALLTEIKKFKTQAAAESPGDSGQAGSAPQQQQEKTQQVARLEELPAADNNTSQSEGSQASASDSAAADSSATGEEGWAVRVGTFSRKANVDSVSALLTNSGFNARTTSVKTDLGEATRIWLGPYSDRDTAEKVSVRLKTLTGEKGYVTRHDS